jgi:hypothetical protein
MAETPSVTISLTDLLNPGNDSILRMFVMDHVEPLQQLAAEFDVDGSGVDPVYKGMIKKRLDNIRTGRFFQDFPTRMVHRE